MNRSWASVAIWVGLVMLVVSCVAWACGRYLLAWPALVVTFAHAIAANVLATEVRE